ncbi:MAG: phenylalanine--tRNA ligase subunit beta [Syntrophobacteraceae bacterium]|nr:phenylalanine--tRNA ligase subunit beta [Syntrophobacteraceae bacterium]
MLISLKWLSDYVNCPLSAERIAEGLTMTGLEVESNSLRHPQLQNVVTARIEAVEPHPDADRLKICVVDAGGAELLRIVCGAPNARAGCVAPLALPGAELAGGTVREAKVRGELSRGMLCSQKELGLGEDHSGIWLLPDDTAPGRPLDEALGIKDVLLEVAITPNRGDCLSFLGIAREVAALCKTSARYPAADVEETGPPIDSLTSIAIDDPKGCPRYAARVIRGVKIGPSPQWLKDRVEAIGVRSINNIVDVTNFVMMELGQPLHAFDFNRLREGRIVVRKAKAGERFTTLDGVERSLGEGVVLICDGIGPVAIGGVMGGLNSEIAPDTCDVLIESAYFDPISIRRASRNLGLKTEASYRFERGTDPDGVLRALDRAAGLMVEVGGGFIAAGRIDVCPNPLAATQIDLRVDKVNRFLGICLSVDEVVELLERIEMGVSRIDSDLLRVRVPGFRSDITREVDLAEEVARLSGYDQIPVTSPLAAVHAADSDPQQMSRARLKDVLVGGGFFEVINYSFISPEALRMLRYPEGDASPVPIRVKNPLSDEQAVMRTTLLPGLLNNARYNIDHRSENFKIFELSKVFLPSPVGLQAEEIHHLAGIMAGKRVERALYSGEDVDYADAKGVVEHICGALRIGELRFRADSLPPWLDPCASACVYANGQRVGEVGRVHLEVREAFDLKRAVFAFRLDFDRLFALKGPAPVYRGLPKFPPVPRDLALVAEEALPVEEPLDFICSLQEPLMESIEIFDIFKSDQIGEGKKSIGYRLTYRAADRSLTDEEVNRVHTRLIAKVTARFVVSMR